MLDVVDFGTKKGAALIEFLKKGSLYFSLPGMSRKNCLGIDRQTKYKRVVERAKFQFQAADLLDDEVLKNLPEANYYLAWHFLEHLPSKSLSDKLVAVALDKAERGCWFRLPSFQQDERTGEGALRKHGLRFAWTRWKGHPSYYLTEDCQKAISGWAKRNKRDPKIKVKPAGYIKNTHDRRVVPIDAPIDTVTYTNSMGPKPLVTFKPPLVDAWEVLVDLS